MASFTPAQATQGLNLTHVSRFTSLVRVGAPVIHGTVTDIAFPKMTPAGAFAPGTETSLAMEVAQKMASFLLSRLIFTSARGNAFQLNNPAMGLALG